MFDNRFADCMSLYRQVRHILESPRVSSHEKVCAVNSLERCHWMSPGVELYGKKIVDKVAGHNDGDLIDASTKDCDEAIIQYSPRLIKGLKSFEYDLWWWFVVAGLCVANVSLMRTMCRRGRHMTFRETILSKPEGK